MMLPHEDPSVGSAEDAATNAIEHAPGLDALLGDDREQLAREMLHDVIDPELGVDIVNLGLLRSVKIEGDTADIVFTVTTPACPLSSYIEDEIRSCLWQLPDVKYTNVSCVHQPPWKPEDMTDLARQQLGWED
jgi:metal-sulfur cluster biosynthetic enzyme